MLVPIVREHNRRSRSSHFLQITSGVCIALPAPKHPPPILTAELAIHGAMATRATILLAVPSMIEVRVERLDDGPRLTPQLLELVP